LQGGDGKAAEVVVRQKQIWKLWSGKVRKSETDEILGQEEHTFIWMSQGGSAKISSNLNKNQSDDQTTFLIHLLKIVLLEEQTAPRGLTLLAPFRPTA
jgi:hypothetical protein